MKFAVGAAFKMIVALDLKRDIVGPSLGTLDKAIVESRHSSWGIYTKRDPNAVRVRRLPRQFAGRVCGLVFFRQRLFRFCDCLTEFFDSGDAGRTQTILCHVAPDRR